jgi:hypothetical protein
MGSSTLTANMILPQVESLMDEIYIGVEGAGLRKEDRQKAVEVAAMLVELDRTVRQLSSRSELVLVDAAAGKSCVGLLAARLILEPSDRTARVVVLERDPCHLSRAKEASRRLGSSIPVEFVRSDVADTSSWPQAPAIVVALHACGTASDAIIESVVACQARRLLLVPCCTGQAMPSAQRAAALATALRIPRQAPVRRRFIQACVDAERTWRLEAAGYQTEVVELVAATVTPHHLMWRARHVDEPVRAARARAAYEAWCNGAGAHQVKL